MTTGQRLKELRTAKGWTQQKVANYCNLKRASYSNYETDTINPSVQVLVLLSTLFNVSLDYLTCKDNQKNNKETLPTDVEKYEDVPLIDIDTLSYLRNIQTPIEKLLQGKHMYCYSPINSIENRIRKNDLLFIQQSIAPKNGDIILARKGATSEFILGCIYRTDNKLLLYSNDLYKKFIILNKTYTIIGIIKEVTIHLRK